MKLTNNFVKGSLETDEVLLFAEPAVAAVEDGILALLDLVPSGG